MKTSELNGRALAWAVGTAEGCKVETWHAKNVAILFPGAPRAVPWEPHIDWSQGGPIMDREHIENRPTITEGGYRTSDSPDAVQARILLPNGATVFDPSAVISEYGPTTLIAAMRCYVASKLGDEVDVPNELTGL